SGDSAGARDWAQAALRVARGGLRPRALIQVALAAQYRREYAVAEAALDAGRAALEDPETGWRWRRVRAMGRVGRGDSAAAAGELAQALGEARRHLGRADAASLWNDLALARAQAGDLAGAERACRHALRLWEGCEGPQRLTLALFNLAEIRLRRGRAAGAWEILERCLREDERAGNVLGLVRDAELVARYELLQGRPEIALERSREALAGLERRHAEGPRGELTVLMARALGWLGRAEEAAAALRAAPPAAWSAALEPDEIPALLALAGQSAAALEAGSRTPLAPLWRGALGGESTAAADWGLLRRLEPFAAARLVFDLELVRPGVAPAYWRRWGSAQLRRAGATALAERLEAAESEPWRAIEAYSSAAPGERRALAELFAGAGYPEARLAVRGADGERVVVPGIGGDELLLAPLGEATLELRAPLVDALLRAMFALARRDLVNAAEAEVANAPPGHGGIVGESPALLAALARVERLAGGDLPVLILGESGTGKELVAQEVHRRSRRAAAPFLALNCAAFTETLLVSELFGHARGSFTGADRDRPGIFETARGGTVFLDEIGDLPPPAQGMLLRVLQEKEVRRVGESQPRRVDVRVVAATHRDLAEMVRRSAFRQDLYYRLKVATATLPPLRERGGDVLRLARHFLAQTGAEAPRLAPAARAMLEAHDWPGNVRELRNVLEVAAALATGAVILPEHLDLPSAAPAAIGGGYHRELETWRREKLERALQASGGNLAEAARRLGVSRQYLSYAVRQLGLRRPPGRPRS
ncbi:MAG TPA: sigma 54-interacting transcriptional regulator, partial [Thermoanaerobaculia bacterium]|nr:sigma 54-interacting transcriptional regulator [Thermoanaerobaculia bacterium]